MATLSNGYLKELHEWTVWENLLLVCAVKSRTHALEMTSSQWNNLALELDWDTVASLISNRLQNNEAWITSQNCADHYFCLIEPSDDLDEDETDRLISKFAKLRQQEISGEKALEEVEPNQPNEEENDVASSADEKLQNSPEISTKDNDEDSQLNDFEAERGPHVGMEITDAGLAMLERADDVTQTESIANNSSGGEIKLNNHAVDNNQGHENKDKKLLLRLWEKIAESMSPYDEHPELQLPPHQPGIKAHTTLSSIRERIVTGSIITVSGLKSNVSQMFLNAMFMINAKDTEYKQNLLDLYYRILATVLNVEGTDDNPLPTDH